MELFPNADKFVKKVKVVFKNIKIQLENIPDAPLLSEAESTFHFLIIGNFRRKLGGKASFDIKKDATKLDTSKGMRILIK